MRYLKNLLSRLKQSNQINEYEYAKLRHCVEYNLTMDKHIDDLIKDYESSLSELDKLSDSKEAQNALKTQLGIVIHDLKALQGKK